MINNPIRDRLEQAKQEGQRLVVPLVGFPGLNMTGCTIKLAQQNYGEHYKSVKAIAREFQPDVIFPLMDLAVEANALGRYTVFPKEESATVVKEPFSIKELEEMKQINIAFDSRVLGYVETLKLMRIGFDESMIKGAYVTGPYSLAALLMGADEAAMAAVLNPDNLTLVCEFATEAIQEYVRALIAAGAQAICILEPSAVMLGPKQFEQFSSRYVNHIIESCKYTGIATIYHTCGNTMHLIDKMVDAGIDALSLDSPDAGVDLTSVAKTVPENVIVMGNLNPTGTLLKGTPAEVKEEVSDLLSKMEPYPNFILSTGCDLPQEVPLDNIRAFMEAGRRQE